MEPLKLAALDAEDLAVVSAHLQDAIVKVADLAFLPAEHRFALVARRFDWEAVPPESRRRLTGLQFERVQAVRTRGIDREAPGTALSLLAVTFSLAEAPSGTASLIFAGGAEIALDVECLEAGMRDLGPVWASESRPGHDPAAA